MSASMWDYPFIQYALVAGLLASIGCGVMGTWVVVKRIGFMSGGIAHAALGGMGVAWYFQQSPILGALIAALLGALIIGWVRLRFSQQEDTLISAIWASGMAIGILFISQTPGYNVNLTSFLFGNILMVSPADLKLMLIMDVVIIFAVALLYKPLLAVAFDEEFARVRGLHVDLYYILLLCMVALTVVLLIQVVGLILVIALLTLPAAIALQFAGSLGKVMAISVVLGAMFVVSGLGIAIGTDLPAGPIIILIAATAYVLVSMTRSGNRV